MYRNEDRTELPLGESLKDTIARVIPYFESEIKPQMNSGRRVLIAAHGNSLRALVMYLEHLTPEEISAVNIPTGVPLVYELDDQYKVLEKSYLGSKEALQAKMAAVANQGKAK